MKKVYYVEKVKGKDGITRPVTKVKIVKDCPACGLEMVRTKAKKGARYRRRVEVFECQHCPHRELEETDLDKSIRLGYQDHNLGILKPHIEP